ncbi:hypothetical protein DR864_19435 [Runella rosea]|uniref:Uncharacterized protein n=1 Tax=Runella rosea TaxID=2259595 RepID=A0A344TM86_9BACT|nr:hypothetical protein [Runella rosea]AXE19757.1 hypothetical protein DR864_19435 [Runella rosea]
MKFPLTASELTNEIYISVDKYPEIGDLRIRQLMKILSNVPDELLIEGLIKVFENNNRRETEILDQEFAGQILKEIKPKTDVALEIILKKILSNWNKSVEEVPFWFKENYGIEICRHTLESISNEAVLTKVEKEKLETMKWWLEIK